MSKLEITDNSVISLMAPTASGKTALAYELYDTGRYELISVDSALIYNDMNIGSAKPTMQELIDYPHHLVNIIDPTEGYSVSAFIQDTHCLVDDIHERGKIPLLVGGTMMYYMALFDGISNVPTSDPQMRVEVDEWRQVDGIESLHAYLQTVDKITAARLHSTDTQRVTRAIEVYKQTGRPISEWQAEPKTALAHNPMQNWIGLGVMPDRSWLHQRIELRLDMMWNNGFVPEVLSLINKYPLTTDSTSMRCVGYRQVIDQLLATNILKLQGGLLCLTEGIDEQFDPFKNNDLVVIDDACKEMKNKALYATRQLAKRQSTWLKKLIRLSDSDNKTNHVKQLSMLSFDGIEKVKQLLI